MDLTKRKHFTPKKEHNFLMTTFFVSLFRLEKSQLWLSFTMQQFDGFFKTFRNLEENICDGGIFSKVAVHQNGLNHARLLFSFPSTILWLHPNIEQKHSTLNGIIVWCKNYRVVKNLSNSGSFSLLSFPEYLNTIRFYSFYAKISRIF